jgi:cytochrome c553
VPPPDASDPAKLGEYLTRIGMCANCHDGEDKEGHTLPYAGGRMIPGPNEESKVAASNLTSDPSGISYYDETLFIRTIRTGHVGARELDAAMPWRYFGNLQDDDLKHIFAFLRTLKPIKHRVDNTEPPTYCKVCGQRHGGGETN